MSLVPDYGNSSSSSSSSSSDESNSDEDLPSQPSKTAPKAKLPTPDFAGNSHSDDPDALLRTSVFKNAFTEAENAKEAILQKHVKMVETKDNVVVINGKKICWNYRKGRCRFGHNCKFAHDSDIQKSKEQLDSEKQVQQTLICQNTAIPQPSAQEIDKIRQESIAQNQQKRKKRPGLTQGLVPGKKVMKNYANQKT